MNLCYNSIFLPGFVGKSILGTDQAPTGSRPLVHPCPFWKKSKVHPQIYVQFRTPSKAPSGRIWVGVVVLLLVTTQKQSQLPGLAWDDSDSKSIDINLFLGGNVRSSSIFQKISEYIPLASI